MAKGLGTIRRLIRKRREKSPDTVGRLLTRNRNGPGRIQHVAAWSVHLYTALGLVCAAGIAVCIAGGLYQWAFALMFVATIIDATDGTLARAAKVHQVLPSFDGRRLDDLIDFLTYTFLPLFLIWHAGVLSGWQGFWLLAPLLASAYGFCHVQAKTDDGFFLGFPSYWNLVAFYLYVLAPPEWLSLTLLITFAGLTFVPARYLYPTRHGRLNLITNGLGAIWAVLVAWILCRLFREDPLRALTRQLALASLFFPAYYLVASWIVSLRHWRQKSH